jgi:hypothetical protein
MVIFLRKTFLPTFHSLRPAISGDIRQALIISQVLAFIAWLAALWFRASSPTPVWYDQQTTFTQLVHHIGDPYRVPGFVNPPWTAILLAPFGLLSLELSTLIQLCLYFAILTGVIFKFGGSTRIVLLALTSFFALDAALELNIDWLVCLGLLVPPMLSGPFLLVKPQNAFGYWLSFKWRDFIRAAIVVNITLVISLVLWGAWPLQWWEAIQHNTLGRFYNLAPMGLLPVPVSITIGLALGVYAFRRRDPVLSILAGLFFVPYITLYALLPSFALFAVRFPRIALLISVVIWAVYGSFPLRYFLRI